MPIELLKFRSELAIGSNSQCGDGYVDLEFSFNMNFTITFAFDITPIHIFGLKLFDHHTQKNYTYTNSFGMHYDISLATIRDSIDFFAVK